MATAVLAGSTGLVGSHILSTLAASSKLSTIKAYTRRALSNTSTKVQPIESADTSTWAASFPPSASIFFSGLGTTRAQAGGVANQRKIDVDLNIELAQAAANAGVETYVLISSTGANATSMMPYSKMKGELEEAVGKMGFKHVLILRPGFLLGDRGEKRIVEGWAQSVARMSGKIGLMDSWAQEADVVARAAVNAGLQCFEGKRSGEEKVWLLAQSDIVRLGRTEWVEETTT
ncbi:hypothetical protein BT63DRAFT_484255 [Microthyrium microscopicum]|uniref:NAD dependent epimerase/dehydratase family protein-like protein n=1 Tax=Microthyrium microscopicum TaxID=703497 RepID=A0A6A6TWJ8_9PEZI|nr:hypothetical protein BT63DRAFT_484255 [Microthyrium microscopicum]